MARLPRLVCWGLFAAVGAVATPAESAQPGARPPAKHGAAPKPPAAQPAPKGARPAKKPAKKPAKAVESKKAEKKPGSEPKAADPAARASVAGKPVDDSAQESPELKGLREVDDLLFWDIEVKPALGAPSLVPPTVVSSGLPPSAPAAPDSTTTDVEHRWMSKLRTPDLPFRWDVRLIRYLDYFKNNPKGRNFVAGLLRRSGRYEEKLRAALAKKGLPQDLVYLALVESGMNPRVVSHAGAAGLWQFMPKAADAYGLRIDRWVDERLDPHRSTEAAVRFLSDLHTRFGRWELAMAAYNMGHGGLLTAIRKYNTNDFWELSQLEAGVPYETALYVPKIVAIAFVAKNKEVFGCADLIADPPEKFDVAQVGPGTSLSSVAEAAKVERQDVQKLNPQLLGESLPPSADKAQSFRLNVPAGTRSEVESRLLGEGPSNLDKRVLRWGESLERVALSVGTTESKLRALNGLKDPVPPRPGTVVLVPKTSSSTLPAQDPIVAVVPARTTSHAGRARVFYEVVWGDKLDDVARVLGVTKDELCQWNNLDRSANLHGKMLLQAFVPEAHKLSDVRVVPAKDATILTVGSTEFHQHFEAKNGRTRLELTVQKGDTMASLAKKHGLSLGMMERINQRSRDAALKPGETVVVYGKQTAPKPGPAPASDPYADDALDARPDGVEPE